MDGAVVDDLTKRLLEALIVTRVALEYSDRTKTALAEIDSAKALAVEVIKMAVKDGLDAQPA
jgi:hypothetical protein